MSNDPNGPGGPEDPYGLGWADRQLRRFISNDLYELGNFDDPDGPIRPDDPDRLSRPGYPYRLSRLDDPYRLSRVDLKDTSFKKFNLNFFYKKMILDFELDLNILIYILEKIKLILLKK